MRYLFEYKGFALPNVEALLRAVFYLSKRAWIETFEWLWLRTFLYLFLKLEGREDVLEKALKEGVPLETPSIWEEEPRRIAAS